MRENSSRPSFHDFKHHSAALKSAPLRQKVGYATQLSTCLLPRPLTCVAVALVSQRLWTNLAIYRADIACLERHRGPWRFAGVAFSTQQLPWQSRRSEGSRIDPIRALDQLILAVLAFSLNVVPRSGSTRGAMKRTPGTPAFPDSPKATQLILTCLDQISHESHLRSDVVLFAPDFLQMLGTSCPAHSAFLTAKIHDVNLPTHNYKKQSFRGESLGRISRCSRQSGGIPCIWHGLSWQGPQVSSR